MVTNADLSISHRTITEHHEMTMFIRIGCESRQIVNTIFSMSLSQSISSQFQKTIVVYANINHGYVAILKIVILG